MNDKLTKIHQYLLSQNVANVPTDLSGFEALMGDDGKAAKVHNYLLSQNIANVDTDFNNFKDYIGLKKKDISLSPLESASKGESVLQDFGLGQEKPLTGQLPSELQQTKQEETLAGDYTVSSVLKAQQKLPSYMQQEQDRLVGEIETSLKDELTKLQSNYQIKIKENPEESDKLIKEFEAERDKIIDLRTNAIYPAIEGLQKKGKDYKYLDPTDAKGIGEEVKKIMAGVGDFATKESKINAIRDTFMRRVGTYTPEERSAVLREITDVIAQNSAIDEKGIPTVYGWKQEVKAKKETITNAINEALAKNPELRKVESLAPIKPVAQMTAEEKEFLLLKNAERMMNKTLSLPDDGGNFWQGFASQGQAMATAGFSDFFEAAGVKNILQKSSKGEKLTTAEQAIVDAYGIFNTAQNAEEISKGYQRGKGIAGSVAFMETFALTGGTAGIGEKTAMKLLGNQLKSKVAQNVIKGVGGAVARTPLMTGGYTEATKRMSGTPSLNAEGEWKVEPATVEPAIEAIGKGLYSNFANALGETAGGWLAGTGVNKVISKGLGINKIPKGVANVFKAVGMQPLGELPEEYLTTLMETPVMGDQTLKEAFSAENVWETAVQVGLMSGFFGGIALPSVVNENIRRKQNAEMIRIFGKDKIAEIRNAIENNDKEAYKKAFEGLEILENEKRQIVRYANFLAQEKGAGVAQEAAKVSQEPKLEEEQKDAGGKETQDISKPEEVIPPQEQGGEVERLKKIDIEYPIIENNEIEGMDVLDDIPNMDSIESSLTDYEVLDGIRQVSFSSFTQLGGLKYYSPQEERRTKNIAEQILNNRKISPLIVVIDKEGPYILEGGHRFDALRELGIESFPAKVVLDLESVNEASEEIPQAKKTLDNYLNNWANNTLRIKDKFMREVKEDFDMVLQKLKNMELIKTDCFD